MESKIIAATIDDSSMLTGIGRAQRIAIIEVKEGKIAKIEEFEVKWDEAHEKEEEGLHHANIARFLRSHNVTDIIAFGAGPDMQRMIERLGIRLHFSSGDYQEAAKRLIESA
ncbi:MAG: NifB/NifX family molybdenum-iron cluster-binding protein [Candidatus Micrarchaeia archaeon]|jgi:predicted Fe-Mo cluster-binding NifX family protein